ncbi:MAG: bifunctional folylpolyglutamate synthase/dihydrofolate synthase [Bacteroidetes bacterium]|nr:bifunctional folylpolyglutamate synthase/dihydrofolate synthase [Bacteroidota bacterium]
MTYQETIDYLFARLPMFSRIGAAAYKADLTNTIQLCAAVGNPQHQFKSIHIAGTNGKGSTSHMLAGILQTAGYKTGLYTSPHLKDFRERIRINGQMVPEQFVIDFTQRIQTVSEAIEPSFFELTVAMAFSWFAEQQVDVVVVETGLGGRLDSTNVIMPELSIITNIGYDHMNLLGNTLEKIAGEKAGIIKPGVPVVLGESLPETLPVFEEKAKEMNAPLHLASQKRQITDWQWQHHELWVSVADEHHADHTVFHLDLPGIYQRKNLLTVLEACAQLRTQGWTIPSTAIQSALRQTKKLTGLRGRWDIIHQQPLVILDVAHNEDGIRQLLQQVELTPHQQLHIVTGMVKDKDVSKVLSLLPADAHYYFSKAQIPRAMPERQLAAKAAALGLKGKTFSEVNRALRAAIANAGPEDLVLVCGSVFLVGEVI